MHFLKKRRGFGKYIKFVRISQPQMPISQKKEAENQEYLNF